MLDEEQTMTTPQFELLQNDQNKIARLTTIRNAVTPLLASNYFSHFTDHSVNHSDQLCNIVDGLAATLEQQKTLNPDEAFVLYVACYLHDVGMQHQRAVKTQIVSRVLGESLSAAKNGRSWGRKQGKILYGNIIIEFPVNLSGMLFGMEILKSAYL
jgi:hypothetical protein